VILKKRKVILCVTYGGIHPHLVIPVLKKLNKEMFTIKILALTSSKKIYESYGFEVFQAKDFLTHKDLNARKFGEQLLEEMRSNDSKIIDEEETIAYLGLSFLDLVRKYESYKVALKKYSKNGRIIFEPKTLTQRVFEKVNPNLVLTTNSPRMEKQVSIEAKKRHIPTVLITDRFSQFEHYQFVAKKICVHDKYSANNLIKTGIKESSIEITGNVFYDNFARLRGKFQSKQRIQKKQKTFLWIDQSSFLSGETLGRIWRSNKNIKKHIELLSKILKKYNIRLIVRPHPSQDINLYDKLARRNICLTSKNEDIYTACLNADYIGGYSSTVLISSYFLGKLTFIFNPTKEKPYIPITNKNFSLEVRSNKHFENYLNVLSKNPKLPVYKLEKYKNSATKIAKLLEVI